MYQIRLANEANKDQVSSWLPSLAAHNAAVVDGTALALDPNNYHLLNDLGWTLSESGQFAEAEALLEKAIDVAPPGDDLARNNLKDARHRKRSAQPH
jgi:Flp pilus assembly protein TadD